MLVGISLSCVNNQPANQLDPKTISGLRLWLKSDAGVLDASNNPITVDSTAVATWQDQSPNNYHATQASASLRPIWRNAANGQGGKPAVAFDGTARYLTRSQQLFTTAVSVFIVLKFADASGRYWPFDLAGEYPNHFGLDPNSFQAPAGRIAFFAGDSNYYGNLNNTALPQLVSLYSDTVANTSVTSTATFRLNRTGMTITKQNGNGLWPNYAGVGASGFTIGRGTNLTTLYMNGQIYELLVYNRVVTTAERDAIEAYLVGRWNIV